MIIIFSLRDSLTFNEFLSLVFPLIISIGEILERAFFVRHVFFVIRLILTGKLMELLTSVFPSIDNGIFSERFS